MTLASAYRPIGRDDVTFGDDLHPLAQAGVGAQGVAQNGLGRVTAIDIGLIEGGNALIQTGLNLGLDMAQSEVSLSSPSRHMP